jgi:hypothetical protein
MTTTKFLIEKNVEAETAGPGAPYKYPFEDMDVNDSFYAGVYKRKKSKSIYGSIYHFLKQDGNQGKKFTCRKTKDNKIIVKREA